jgi:hypothetical protein
MGSSSKNARKTSGSKGNVQPAMNPTLATGLKSIAVGGSIAATLALIRQLAEANRQRKEKERRESDAISPNTIVLRVRKNKDGYGGGEKYAEAVCQGKTVKVEPTTSSREIRPTASVHTREPNGRFTEDIGKEKSAGFLTDSVSGAGDILAAGGGAVLGYALVSKLAQRLEQKRLEKQIAAAQTEYVNLLDGKQEKSAETKTFSRLFLFDDSTIPAIEVSLHKQAGVPTDIYDVFANTPRVAQGMTSGMIAAWILGAGASAYVAKRLLENKFDKEEEEEPEKPTRIIFKAGEDSSGKLTEFEISPDKLLATVGIMRECIADSVPEGVKLAADVPDYSFLDDIARMEGGKQWLLDRYAMNKGLSRPDTKDLKLPLSLLIRHGHTLADVRDNLDKHIPAINSKVLSIMQKDPEGWFKLLGSDRNKDLVRLEADKWIDNLGNSGGILGVLGSIPIVGGLTKGIVRSLSGLSSGTKTIGKNTLSMMGVTGDKARTILDGYKFSNGGWKPKATVKAAGAMNNIMAVLAREKMLADKTNKDILRAIEELKQSKSKRTKKDKPVNVEFDSTLDDSLSDKDKERIQQLLAMK